MTANAEHPILQGLNPPQLEAVRHVDGPLMVLAGAGSGKTRVITHRIAWLINIGIPPETIYAVTFTNKAAAEMRERVRRLTGQYGVVLTTFHSFGARFLRQELPAIGRSGEFSIYDTGDRQSLLKKVMAELECDPKAMPTGGVAEKISSWKNRLVSPEEALVQEEGMDTEARIYARYQERLEEANACDFDDLLGLSVRILRDHEEVARRWSEQVQYLMVDEFQDTNPVQYALARRLSTNGNISITGDPDQSIYAWRGADPESFDRFLEDHPSAKSVALEQNYRSTGHILHCASELIAQNPGRIPKRLFTSGEDGEVVRIVGFEDEYEEARSIAAAVEEWREDGYTPSQMAVFYRTNDLSLAVERALVHEGIPYQVVGGLEFFARQEVKDLLAYLRFLANPQDTVAGMRILNTPPRGIGGKTQDIVLDLARRSGKALGEVLRSPVLFLDLSKRARTALEAFSRILEELDSVSEENDIVGLLETILEVTGYQRYWELRASKNGESDPHQNIGQLVNLAAEFQARNEKGGLAAFLEQVALLSDLDRWDGECEKVSLMSLHSSKGLEFDAVVVIGVEDGLLPHAMSFGDPRGREEERRLLHVGMTRARRRLVLTWARRRTRFGRSSAGIPSSFLDEIGDVGVERFGEWGPPAGSFESTGYDDSQDQRWEDEDLEYHPLASLRPGVRVRHSDFGLGEVRRIGGRGRGLNRKVVVRFDNGAERTLVLAYAGLEIVESDEDVWID